MLRDEPYQKPYQNPVRELRSSEQLRVAPYASAARGASCTSSRRLESHPTMSAFSGLVATNLLPGRQRSRATSRKVGRNAAEVTVSAENVGLAIEALCSFNHLQSGHHSPRRMGPMLRRMHQ